MGVGTIVRVLYPFAESFPDEYVISEAIDDGENTTYILEGAGGFDVSYLEPVV